jgi:ribosome-associated protein
VPIRLTERCHVPDDAVEVQFVLGSGPGGQNVNKVATAVQLRLDLDRAGLPEPVRQRLERLAGNRLTKDGEILVDARRFRTQERNRQDALDRLADLVRRAEHVPKPRVPTKPTKSAKKRRTDTKTQRGKTKRMRKAPGPND